MYKISVIVPVYNTIDYLKRCVDSIIDQSSKDFELILVDDGSIDGSSDLCEKFRYEHPKQIKVFHQKNAGVGAARNMGIDQSTGDYLFFVDSDDWISQKTLEILLQIAENRETDLTVGSVYITEESLINRIINETTHQNVVLSPKTNKEVLLMMPSVCNKLFRKEIVDRFSIRFSSLKMAEDMEFLLKFLCFCNRSIYISEARYYYFRRITSAMHSCNPEINRDVMFAFDAMIDFYSSFGVYDVFKAELEYLSVKHILLEASVRVLKIDSENILLKEFSTWTISHFPRLKGNKYFHLFSAKEKIVIYLLLSRFYFILILLFRLVNRKRFILQNKA